MAFLALRLRVIVLAAMNLPLARAFALRDVDFGAGRVAALEVAVFEFAHFCCAL